MKNLTPFWLALQFLSRIPVHLKDPASDADIGRSVLFYPLIGVLLGVLLALLAWFSTQMKLPHLLAAALILVVLTLFSGGLHLDGLADSADAWVGGRGDAERTLAIMKDPCCGPIGVVSLLLVLLLKFAALSVFLEKIALTTSFPSLYSLAPPSFLLLIIPPLLARSSLLLLLLSTPYVRAGGLGETLAAHLPKKIAALILCATGCAMLLMGWVSALTFAAALMMFILLRRMICKLIGGTTGDTAGAILEIIETLALVCIALK